MNAKPIPFNLPLRVSKGDPYIIEDSAERIELGCDTTAQAAFIVKAVNLHEELVGALEAMLAAQNILKTAFGSDKSAAWGIINDVGIKAARALAKAKED